MHGVLLALIALLTGVLLALALPRASSPAAETLAPSAPAIITESPSPSPPPTPDPVEEQSARMSALLVAFRDSHQGRWSLCWLDLSTGAEGFAATDREPMVAASLIKLYIMAAVYEQVEAGALEAEAVQGLLESMITVSDNWAANELIRRLGQGDAAAGMTAVNDFCSRGGYTATRLNRLMLAGNGLENYTTAEDCTRLLGEIYHGRCVSYESSEKMLALLLRQQVNDRLPARLPEGTPVAHKTGDLSGLSFGDVGIVYAPAGDYILCAVVNDPPWDAAAIAGIAELSEQVFAFAPAGDP